MHKKRLDLRSAFLHHGAMFNATHGIKTMPCYLIDHNGFRFAAVYHARHQFFAYVQGGVTRYIDSADGAAFGYRVEWL